MPQVVLKHRPLHLIAVLVNEIYSKFGISVFFTIYIESSLLRATVINFLKAPTSMLSLLLFCVWDKCLPTIFMELNIIPFYIFEKDAMMLSINTHKISTSEGEQKALRWENPSLLESGLVFSSS